MASMHEEEVIDIHECANCGATEGLLKCSRCHTAMFCGVKCQRAYWPFHKIHCRRNEFADLIEESEPKFAKWMRSHGKLAVLKDDEVDRLERASTAVSGPSREDVMESMYGRLDPKPKVLPSITEASYSAEERIAMKRRQEADKIKERRTAALTSSSSFHFIDIPQDLGLDCGDYKWKQSQTHVEVFIPLPDGIPTSKAKVTLKPRHISVEFDEKPLLHGTLYRDIKAEESTWYIQDGMIEIIMVKRSRRGNYANGESNADTFWKSVLEKTIESHVLQIEHPPLVYYWSFYEDDGVGRLEQRKGRNQIAVSGGGRSGEKGLLAY